MSKWIAEFDLEDGDTMPEHMDLNYMGAKIDFHCRPMWIPVSERLPEELEPVNITWVNHNPERYYADIKDKPFAATGVFFNGQWYWWSVLCTDILSEYSHNYDDVIDDDIEIIAWQPLPEPYKEENVAENQIKIPSDAEISNSLIGLCEKIVKEWENGNDD